METNEAMTMEPKGTRGGTIKARPIVVYPQSDEQRSAFQEAANEVARGKLSPFMLLAAEEFKSNRKIIEVTRPTGERGKTIMVYPDSPEQRESFQDKADKQGMDFSPFMLYAAEQFIAKRKKK